MALSNENDINAIRSKADIVSIIGSYIPLTQRGKNFVCVCPFHDDHSPRMFECERGRTSEYLHQTIHESARRVYNLYQ